MREKVSNKDLLGTGSNIAKHKNSAAVVEKRLYTIKEAAQFLGRSVHGLRELIWAGKIPEVRDGRKIWLDIYDLEAFIARNKSVAI